MYSDPTNISQTFYVLTENYNKNVSKAYNTLS